MGILQKICQIFRSNATFQDRANNKLMMDAPWSGVYDRSARPKDIHGAMAPSKDIQKK